MKKRVAGYDIARALAIFGMVIVNFKIVMGATHGDPNWLVSLLSIIDGRAAALFVVLAGVGISLLSKGARTSGNVKQIASLRSTLLKRALFLFIAGLLFIPIWPADILHFYGIYIATAAFLLTASKRRLWTYAGMIVGLFVVLIVGLDYEQGWNWTTLDYAGFWTPEGMVRHLFFNGFHPVTPWLAFLLTGMILGRWDMLNPLVRRRVFFWGAGIAVVAEGLSRTLVHFFSTGVNAADQEIVSAIFGTQPMPPLALFMFAGAGTACAIIAVSISVGERFHDAIWIRPFVATGQLALTLYVAHVVVGMGVLEAFGRLENQTPTFSLLAALLFCLSGTLFAVFWVRKARRGPLEAAMRMLSDPGRTTR